jgi:hypothetical protein
MAQGQLTVEQRASLAKEYGLKYIRVYKIEWDFKNNSDLFSEVIKGYPDDQAMCKVLDKFRQWNRAKSHLKPFQLFQIEKNQV